MKKKKEFTIDDCETIIVPVKFVQICKKDRPNNFLHMGFHQATLSDKGKKVADISSPIGGGIDFHYANGDTWSAYPLDLFNALESYLKKMKMFNDLFGRKNK